MALRMRITKKLLDATKRPQKGQVFLRDVELPGFGVRFTHGATTFILEKRISGRMRRLSIGPYGPFTLEQARDKARVMIGAIASGQDPAQERINRRQEPTFNDLIEAYRTRHLPNKKSAFKDEENIKNHLSQWENRHLSAIQRKDVSKLHFDIGTK